MKSYVWKRHQIMNMNMNTSGRFIAQTHLLYPRNQNVSDMAYFFKK